MFLCDMGQHRERRRVRRDRQVALLKLPTVWRSALKRLRIVVTSASNSSAGIIRFQSGPPPELAGIGLGIGSADDARVPSSRGVVFAGVVARHFGRRGDLARGAGDADGIIEPDIQRNLPDPRRSGAFLNQVAPGLGGSRAGNFGWRRGSLGIAIRFRVGRRLRFRFGLRDFRGTPASAAREKQNRERIDDEKRS